MEGSMGLGIMAVFAVSGSVVLLARQVDKRLLSDFMKKIECEMCGSRKYQKKKRVRFADDMIEHFSSNKSYEKKSLAKRRLSEQFVKMPVNRQILYKGMIEYKNLQSQNFM